MTIGCIVMRFGSPAAPAGSAGRRCEGASRHRFMARLRSLLAVAGSILCLALGLPEPALAVDVDQVIWGFDGQLVLNRFNLLSIQVSNPSPQTFEGTLRLTKSIGGRRVDVPFVETVYLSPHSTRWVQFHPYVKSDWEEWSLSWGSGPKDSYSFPKPRMGKRACVALDDMDSLSVSGGVVKRFPEHLFPANLSACDGLRDVVLDHVPRWEPARQRAFVEWLSAGGRVHILQSSRAEFPRFTGALEALGSELPRVRVGLGYVFHHARALQGVSAEYVEQVIVQDRDPSRFPAASQSPQNDAIPSAAPQAGEDELAVFLYEWEGDSPLLTALKKMVRPNHSWPLIHLLSLMYIGLIFPGCFVVSMRREGDYRYVFGALLAIVSLFSLTFFIIGRRGYGERTTVNSVAIARGLPDGRIDVAQWSDAFAVSGGDYNFAHDGSGRIYSTCQTDEPVEGEAISGAEARLAADMPPYSSRSFGHRLVLPPAGVPATIETMEVDTVIRPVSTSLRDLSVAIGSTTERVLKELTLVRGPAFPESYRYLYVLFGRRVYSLTEDGNRLKMKSEDGSLARFLQLDDRQLFDPYFNRFVDKDETQLELFEGLFKPLVARAVEISSDRDAREFALPDDRVRLIVYAPMSADFFVRDERFSSQRGYVLYVHDLFSSEAQ